MAPYTTGAGSTAALHTYLLTYLLTYYDNDDDDDDNAGGDGAAAETRDDWASTQVPLSVWGLPDTGKQRRAQVCQVTPQRVPGSRQRGLPGHVSHLSNLTSSLEWSSEAYLSLSTDDPILASFRLRHELLQVANEEKYYTASNWHACCTNYSMRLRFCRAMPMPSRGVCLSVLLFATFFIVSKRVNTLSNGFQCQVATSF